MDNFNGIPDTGYPSPQVTVLLTVYNGMPYLEEAVQSILRQTCSSFLFSVIDNGSSDGSGEYLKSLNDPRLLVESLPMTLGRTEALNRGLFNVTTEFTAIIDADDVAEPERLAKQTAFLEDHPEVVLVGSNVTYIDPVGNEIGKDAFPEDNRTLVERFAVHNQFAHAACMFRTEAARKAGGYPKAYRYAQDFGLWLALLRHGGKVASIARPLASIRVHPGQATRDRSTLALRREEHLALAEELIALPGVSPAARQAARLRRAIIMLQQGRYASGCKEAGSAFMDAPLLFFFNPLLWRRALVSAKRFL